MHFNLASSITKEEYDNNITDVVKLASKVFKRNKNWWAIDGGYGLIQIYLEFIGLDPKIYIPRFNCFHGFFPGMTDDWYRISEARFKSLPAIFVPNIAVKERVDKIFSHRKKSYIVAHPYHYILENYSSILIDKRHGSVLFLPHSIGKNNTNTFSVEKILNYCLSLPSNYFPITACIHPNDINNFDDHLFNKNGIKIITLGNRHDPKFLHRFFWLTHDKEFALVFDISTHLLLSVLTGLLIKRIPYNIMYLLEINDGSNHRECPEYIYWELYETFYSEIIDQNKLKKSVNKITGYEYILNRTELSTLIKTFEAQFNKNIKPTNYFSLSYKTWNCIEFYIEFLYKIRISLGLRIANLRGQKSIVFGDLYINLINQKKENDKKNIKKTSTI